MMIAALYVQTGGCYFGLDGVDPWDEPRDARTYPGPWPVVAHPPCARWGRYWFGGPSARVRRELGDDGGCFASALAAVRQWGGVLEHPAHSHAWRRFGITPPRPRQGWTFPGHHRGRSCHVEQARYGHRARKATWLYAVLPAYPELDWRESPPGVRHDEGFHSTAERRAARAQGLAPIERQGKRERAATPAEFRDLLISMARSVRR